MLKYFEANGSASMSIAKSSSSAEALFVTSSVEPVQAKRTARLLEFQIPASVLADYFKPNDVNMSF